MNFLRRQYYDALYFYFVPFIAAVLPWTLSRGWLKFWARREAGPYDEAARAAAAVAPDYLDIGDARTFRTNMRLVWLLDCCDMYLSLLRPRRWWPRHIEQSGVWPEVGGFVALGFHHGTGLWVFPSIAKRGLDSQLVSARFDRSDYRGLPLRYWQGRLRASQVKRQSGYPMAFRPGVKEQLARALAAGVAVVGVIDMPPRLAPRGQRPVRLLDHDACFPDGMLALAREAKLPVVPYWVEFDLERCTRRFCIGQALDPADTQNTLQALADVLDRQIRRTPSAWLFWREWPAWIADTAAAVSQHDE